MTVSLTKIVWIRVRVHENIWRIWCLEVLDKRSYRTENIIGKQRSSMETTAQIPYVHAHICASHLCRLHRPLFMMVGVWLNGWTVWSAHDRQKKKRELMSELTPRWCIIILRYIFNLWLCQSELAQAWEDYCSFSEGEFLNQFT